MIRLTLLIDIDIYVFSLQELRLKECTNNIGAFLIYSFMPVSELYASVLQEIMKLDCVAAV